MLKRGVRPDLPGARLVTALHLVLKDKRASSVGTWGVGDARTAERLERLLAAGASPNARDASAMTPLHYLSQAAWMRRPEATDAHSAGCRRLATVLLEAGADIDARDIANATPLLVALDAERHRDDSHGGAHLGHVCPPWAYAKHLVEAGADLNVGYEDGTTALMFTSYSACVETSTFTELLVDRGADLAATDMCRNTAAHNAAFVGNEGVLRVLVACMRKRSGGGAPPSLLDAVNNVGRTPLTLAAAGGTQSRYGCMRVLVEAGADVNIADSSGNTPLHFAVLQNDLQTTDLLVGAGANASPGVGVGAAITPMKHLLHVASRNGFPDMVERLAAAGARVDYACSPGGATALHVAVKKRYPETTRALLRHGARPNVKTHDGETPLCCAVSDNTWSRIHLPADWVTPDEYSGPEDSDDEDAEEFLDYHDGNVDRPDDDIESPHHLVRILVQGGADVNQPGREGRTVLMKAISARCFKVAEWLIGRGANVRHADARGLTTLMAAVQSGNAKLVRALLTTALGAGALRVRPARATRSSAAHPKELPEAAREFVDAADFAGNTALHYAASLWDKASPVLDLLLQAGATVSPVNKTGRTPLADAVNQGRSPARIAALLAAGADARREMSSGIDLLFETVRRDSHMIAARLETIEILLMHGANVNRREPKYGGRTPLHATSELQSPERATAIASLLIASGADLDATDDVGETPLGAAVRKDRRNLAVLLLRHGASVPFAARNKSPYDVWFQNRMVEQLFRENCLAPWKQHQCPMPRRLLLLAKPWILLALGRATANVSVLEGASESCDGGGGGGGKGGGSRRRGSCRGGGRGRGRRANNTRALCLRRVRSLPYDVLAKVLGFLAGSPQMSFSSLVPAARPSLALTPGKRRIASTGAGKPTATGKRVAAAAAAAAGIAYTPPSRRKRPRRAARKSG
mmetsp:Transcript_42010/g.131577  ORF Transcript_42010/g.131577 Transcript_42010/m.131577 type:complete len:929 (+) Transcript_42010:1002-3788(+)